MNRKLVSFICCPAVIGSYSGVVSNAIKGKVPNFIVYTNNGSFFKPGDLEKVNKLIDEINLNKEMKDELLELDKKYGPFEAFADKFYLSDLAKNSSVNLLNLSKMASSSWSKSIATREGVMKDLLSKRVNKTQEKREIFVDLEGSLSESPEDFSQVLKELSKGNISGGPLHVCVEHFYTLVPQCKKLKKDLESTKNLAKQKKINKELLEIEPAAQSITKMCFILKLNVDDSELDSLYKKFLKLSEVQRNKILNLIKLEENIKEIESLIKIWKENKMHTICFSKDMDSYVFSEFYPHISNQGPDFAKKPENGKNTVIERAEIILDGIRKASKIAIKREVIEEKTKEFEKKYPGVFFPWQEIPDNNLVKKLTDLRYDKDLDKKYIVKNPQSKDLLEKLRNQEAEYSNRIANIRECIPNKDFEENKDLDSYIKELIMIYQAREAVRAEIKAEIDIRELFEVLAFNVSQ